MTGGGKEEDKKMDPLFPRLHLNHPEKGGGPRAPPRNKMDLCEQLTKQSHRLTSGSMSSMLPLPSQNASASAASSSPGGYKSSVFPTFSNSPGSTNFTERLPSYCSGGLSLNITLTNLKWQQTERTNYQNLNAKSSKTTAENNLFQPYSFFNSKNSSMKQPGDENDYRASTFAQSRKILSFDNGTQRMDKGNLASLGPNTSGQCESIKVFQTYQNHIKKPESIISTRDKNLVDTSSSSLSRGNSSGPLSNHSLANLDQKESSSLVEYMSRLYYSNGEQYGVLQVNKAPTDGVLVDSERVTRKRSASTSEVLSQEGYVDRNDDISDNSVVDSVSALDVSPDDIVRVIGQKEFWNARRIIVHQQSVFAMQVFELHRLIKVQRLIAKSPELIAENGFYLGKPARKVSLTKKLPTESLLESPPLFVRSNDISEKPKAIEEFASEDTIRKPPLYLPNNEEITRQLDYKPHAGIPLPPPLPPPSATATGTNLMPWCFPQPPGNQWLVPVRSPSEGLVYKPYTGTCPPRAGLLAPFYGNCVPISLTPLGRDFLTPGNHHRGIGILSGTPLGGTYFAPYGMPAINPSASSSAVEQIIPFARSQSKGLYQDCLKDKQASKESDLQDSTANSPPEKEKGNALSLFPITPAVKVSDQAAQNHSTEQPIRVIKVVPYNPKAAAESAARIFQSIQEERKKHDKFLSPYSKTASIQLDFLHSTN